MSQTGPQSKTVHVLQGEHVAIDAPGIVLTTVLGSCIAVCLHDPVLRIGGMNHFLLPGEESGAGQRSRDTERYGVHLMELLVNDLLRMGARRERLQAKLFGGARMMGAFADIGAQNAAFAERTLTHDGIRIVGKDVGGERARRLQYLPCSGRARQMYVSTEPRLVRVEIEQARAVEVNGDVELF